MDNSMKIIKDVQCVVVLVLVYSMALLLVLMEWQRNHVHHYLLLKQIYTVMELMKIVMDR